MDEGTPPTPALSAPCCCLAEYAARDRQKNRDPIFGFFSFLAKRGTSEKKKREAFNAGGRIVITRANGPPTHFAYLSL